MQELYWCLQGSLESRGFTAPLLLGKGAFCQVYRVREEATGRLYACKVGKGSQKVHIRREQEFLRKLKHPLFPRYKGYWEEEGVACLIMEYVAGSSLEALLRRRTSLSERQALKVSAELAEGLLYLQRRGIIFRDVKAQNILIRQDGRVKLLDFGCACLQNGEEHVRAGTPGFAAPEQLIWGKADFACDIYALGKVMQYMLSGLNPCLVTEEQFWKAWGRRHYKRDIRRIIEGCVKENPRERIPDAYTLLCILRPMISGDRRKYFDKKDVNFQLEYYQKKNIWKSSYKCAE